MCYHAQGSFTGIDGEEKWNFEEQLPERVSSAHKGTEMSVLLSMAGAIQRPHIGEYIISTVYPRIYVQCVTIIR